MSRSIHAVQASMWSRYSGSIWWRCKTSCIRKRLHDNNERCHDPAYHDLYHTPHIQHNHHHPLVEGIKTVNTKATRLRLDIELKVVISPYQNTDVGETHYKVTAASLPLFLREFSGYMQVADGIGAFVVLTCTQLLT